MIDKAERPFRKARKIKYSFPQHYPELIKYWDFARNNVNPYTIFPCSSYFAWWTCERGHSIYQQVRVRMRYNECRECAKLTKKVEGSLADIHPELAKQWDNKRNFPVTPRNIKPRSRHKRWWICPEKRHSYKASPDNRVGHGSRCPYCYGHKRSATISESYEGENSCQNT